MFCYLVVNFALLALKNAFLITSNHLWCIEVPNAISSIDHIDASLKYICTFINAHCLRRMYTLTLRRLTSA